MDVRAELVDARTGRHQLYVPFVRGFPSHPMMREDVTAKAMELMAPVLGRARSSEVIDVVMNIEKLDAAAKVIPMIAPL